tara:strand:+ start:355 stop:642 length:288 start_codon:yes stop_codon:yes gene_type:complete
VYFHLLRQKAVVVVTLITLAVPVLIQAVDLVVVDLLQVIEEQAEHMEILAVKLQTVRLLVVLVVVVQVVLDLITTQDLVGQVFKFHQHSEIQFQK